MPSPRWQRPPSPGCWPVRQTPGRLVRSRWEHGPGTYNRLLEEDVAWERSTPGSATSAGCHMTIPKATGGWSMRSSPSGSPRHCSGPSTPDLDPHVSAARYEAALRQIIPDGVRRPHLAVLGVGDDGHTAPFPRVVMRLAVGDRLYTATRIPSNETWRLTSTIPMLHATQHLVFIVAGNRKAEAVAQFEGEGNPLPARIVADGAEDGTVLLDGRRRTAHQHLVRTDLTATSVERRSAGLARTVLTLGRAPPVTRPYPRRVARRLRIGRRGPAPGWSILTRQGRLPPLRRPCRHH